MTIASEFDPFVVSNAQFSKRLQDNGRLVEAVVYPGANHGFMYEFSFNRTKDFWADLKLAVDTYVHKN